MRIHSHGTGLEDSRTGVAAVGGIKHESSQKEIQPRQLAYTLLQREGERGRGSQPASARGHQPALKKTLQWRDNPLRWWSRAPRLQRTTIEWSKESVFGHKGLEHAVGDQLQVSQGLVCLRASQQVAPDVLCLATFYCFTKQRSSGDSLLFVTDIPPDRKCQTWPGSASLPWRVAWQGEGRTGAKQPHASSLYGAGTVWTISNKVTLLPGAAAKRRQCGML